MSLYNVRAHIGLPRSNTFAALNSAIETVNHGQAPAMKYHSQIEDEVINAKYPVSYPNAPREVVQAGPYRGIQLNKHEEKQFRGPRSVSSYQINQDSCPDVIRKQPQNVKYTQEVAVRRLLPPKPEPHGDLIIKEFQQQIPPAPPVVIRQEGMPACDPAPMVFREAPPAPPPRVPTQIIDVEADPVPPPARKVIFEKMHDQPCKPPNILIEKWLPYEPRTRRVIFQRSCIQPPPNPKNVIIEWQQPCVEVEQVCVDLGVTQADPNEYVRRYGPELKQPCEMPNPICPSCVQPCPQPCSQPCPQPCAPQPCGCGQAIEAPPTPIVEVTAHPVVPQLALVPSGRLVRSTSFASVIHPQPTPQVSLAPASACSTCNVAALVGDVHALRVLDQRGGLEKYGLEEYRKFLL